VRIKYAKVTKRPLGYAFIELATHKEALLCKENINGSIICDQKVTVAWATRNTRLFVGDIDSTVSIGDLVTLFSPFGTINLEGTSIKHTESGVPFGVINFVDRDDAEEARAALHGTVFKSCVLYVNWEQSSGRTSITPSEECSNCESPYPFFSVHISFYSHIVSYNCIQYTVHTSILQVHIFIHSHKTY
jgi:RNA recognition motif-containing protein